MVGVVRVAGCLVLCRAIPADHVLRNNTAWVLITYELELGITAQTNGVRARTRLDVVGKARGRGEAALAEGALYLLATVDAGIEMLVNRD